MEGEDNIELMLWGLIFYTVAAYVFLIVREKFKLSTVSELLIVGLLYGVIIEGVIVGELYADPIGTVFVALPWHALVTVLIGWYAIPLWLTMHSYLKQAMWALVFSASWFVWSIGMHYEFGKPDSAIPSASLDIENYAAHALFTFTLLALGHGLMLLARKDFVFRYSKKEATVVMVIPFLFAAILYPGVMIIVAPVMGVLFYGFYRLLRWLSLRKEGLPQLRPVLQEFRVGKLLAVYAIPAISVFFMHAFFLSGVATFEAAYMISLPLFVATCVLCARVFRSPRVG